MMWECKDCETVHPVNPPKCCNCDETDLIQNRSSTDPDVSISTIIDAKISALSGADSGESPCLAESVDPDALESLVASDRFDRFTFRYGGFDVTLHSSGDIDFDRVDD